MVLVKLQSLRGPVPLLFGKIIRLHSSESERGRYFFSHTSRAKVRCSGTKTSNGFRDFSGGSIPSKRNQKFAPSAKKVWLKISFFKIWTRGGGMETKRAVIKWARYSRLILLQSFAGGSAAAASHPVQVLSHLLKRQHFTRDRSRQASWNNSLSLRTLTHGRRIAD